MSRRDTDADLVDALSRSGAGNRTAFAQVYEITSPRIYGLLLRVLRSPNHAAEVTQEVYLEVWQQASRYDPSKGSVLTWMTSIAHRRAVDGVRNVSTTPTRDGQDAARSHPRDIDDVWDNVSSQADTAQLRVAGSRSSAVQREAMTLAYFDGHTQTQIATLLNVPLGTVTTRIRNGLITLRRELKTSEQGSEDKRAVRPPLMPRPPKLHKPGSPTTEPASP